MMSRPKSGLAEVLIVGFLFLIFLVEVVYRLGAIYFFTGGC